MKKILFVSTSPNGTGGVSSVVKALIHSSLADTYSITHLSSHSGKSSLHKFSYQLWSYFLFPFLLIVRKIDLVHIHGSMKTSFLRKSYFLIWAKLLRRKVIYHMHSAKIIEYFDKQPKWKKKLICKLMNRYDRIIALSSYWKQVLKQYTTTEIRVIYNPVTEREDSFLPERVENVNNVLFLGEVCKRKGVHDLIDVAQKLSKKKSIIHFHIGGGGDVASFKKLAEKKGIENITWHGWVSGEVKEGLYKECGIYFLPSYNEGLPMSILEAMGKGFPIISTTVGGIPDAVENERNGYLFSPGDIDGFVSAIETLSTKGDTLLKMSHESIAIVDERFLLDTVVKDISIIYEDLMSGV